MCSNLLATSLYHSSPFLLLVPSCIKSDHSTILFSNSSISFVAFSFIYTIWVKLYGSKLFLSDLFHLAWQPRPIHVVQMAVFHLFFWLSNAYAVVCVNHSSFIRSSIRGHFGCFHVLATVNKCCNEHRSVYIFVNKCFQFFGRYRRKTNKWKLVDTDNGMLVTRGKGVGAWWRKKTWLWMAGTWHSVQMMCSLVHCTLETVHLTVHWDLYNFVNQCHSNNFDLKVR